MGVIEQDDDGEERSRPAPPRGWVQSVDVLRMGMEGREDLGVIDAGAKWLESACGWVWPYSRSLRSDALGNMEDVDVDGSMVYVDVG